MIVDDFHGPKKIVWRQKLRWVGFLPLTTKKTRFCSNSYWKPAFSGYLHHFLQQLPHIPRKNCIRKLTQTWNTHQRSHFPWLHPWSFCEFTGGVSFQATKSPSGFLFVPCTNHMLLLSLSWPIWPVCISYHIIPFNTPTCFDFITKETTLLDRIFAIWPDHLSITYYTHPLSSCMMITYSNSGFTAIVTIPTSWINGGPAFGRRLRSGARWWSASTPRCPRCTTPRSGVWRCSCYDALMRSSWPPRCTGWDSGWVPKTKWGNLVKWSWEM